MHRPSYFSNGPSKALTGFNDCSSAPDFLESSPFESQSLPICLKKDCFQWPSIINGCWQLSTGHCKNQTHPEILLDHYVEEGLTCFDCADIYSGVEEKLGQFIEKQRKKGQALRIHTKFVPDLDCLASLNSQYIRDIIQRSCHRLQVDALDLVQFHWWNYSVGDYLWVLKVLEDLKEEGVIKGIGLTNFNTFHLERILNQGIAIQSIQVQYSFLDNRPTKALASLAKRHNIKLLGYGVLAGGFFTEKWVEKDEPIELENRSLIKYKLIIEEFGGWEKFQSLLKCIATMASHRQMSMADLITLYMLKYSFLDSVILGVTHHFQKSPLMHLKEFSLTDQELEILYQHTHSWLPGDVYDLERDFTTPHAHIMRYNLNQSHP